MALPSPVLLGVYHHTLLLGSAVQLHLGWAGRCLWTLEGARWRHQLHTYIFSTSFSFWTKPLSFGMNAVHLQWYLRVRLLSLYGNWKITTIGKEFRCSIEIFFNIYPLPLSLVKSKWWEREKRMQSSGWKTSHQEVRKLKRSVIIMGFPKQHELGIIPEPEYFML